MAEEDLIFGKNRHLFGGIEPSHMKLFSITSKTGAIKLLANIPDDTIIDGQTLCTVAGAVIRRKEGQYPADEFDGDLVADITTSGTITDSSVDLGKTYYYRAFPYSSQGVYNRSKSNIVKYSPTLTYYIYGFDLDITNPDPDKRVTYPSDVDNELFEPAKMNFTGTTAEGSFSYGNWPSTPGEGFMPRPCIYDNDNGKVYKYLMPDNYLLYVDETAVDIYENIARTDSDSYYARPKQAMMEWSKIYTKRELVNGVYKFRCSSEKLDDTWECWCNYDKNNNECDHFYTSIYKRAMQYISSKNGPDNGYYYLVSTSPYTGSNELFLSHSMSYSVDDLVGRMKNISYDNLESLCDHLLIQDLLIMMAKTTDLKAAYGDGWTETSESTAGALNKKGMFYGAPQYTGTSTQTGRVKVFGMEDYWDSQYSRRLAGLINDHGILKVKLTPGTKDGTTVSEYNTTGDGYLTVSDSYAGSEGYISGCKVASYGRIPIEYSGSETTYECDYVTSDNQQVYFALIGGSLNGDENYGPFGLILNRKQDYAASNILCSMRFTS